MWDEGVRFQLKSLCLSNFLNCCVYVSCFHHLCIGRWWTFQKLQKVAHLCWHIVSLLTRQGHPIHTCEFEILGGFDSSSNFLFGIDPHNMRFRDCGFFHKGVRCEPQFHLDRAFGRGAKYSGTVGRSDILSLCHGIGWEETFRVEELREVTGVLIMVGHIALSPGSILNTTCLSWMELN